MKIIIIIFFLGLLPEVYSQETPVITSTNQSSVTDNILIELKDWDPIRGLWLSESIMAMSTNQTIPDRTFAEELTPYEMLSLLPKEKREDLKNYIETNSTGTQEMNNSFATLLLSLINNTFCRTIQGRSYGDPHLKSFDNANELVPAPILV